MMTNYDLVVIGAGPSGCAAATHASRCRWKVLVINRLDEKGFLGSLKNVNYFPGFPEDISGLDLLKRMHRQAELAGARFVEDTVCNMASYESSFGVSTDNGLKFETRAAVLATGAALRAHYLHNEKEFLGCGVFYDAMVDGPYVAGQVAAVVGKGRYAVEEALVLVRFAKKIHFIIPSSKLDVDDLLLKQLQGHPSIELLFSTSIKAINGDGRVNSITILSGGQEKILPVSGVFTYAHEYQSTAHFLDKNVDRALNGVVKVDSTFQTSVNGIYACGDVLCGRPQLPIISAAQGLLASISVDKFLALKS